MVTHALCFFYSAGGLVRWGTPIALAPKKTLALQVRRGPPFDVAPVLGESEAGATASLVGLAPPVMVTAPSVGQAINAAEGLPSEVAAQPVMEVIPPSASEQVEPLAAAIVATTTVVA